MRTRIFFARPTESARNGTARMIFEILETTRWSQRYRALRKFVQDTIESEGGMVEQMTIIGMLLKSPFPPINIKPVYLKVPCRYSNDRGIWYICGTESSIYWVWSSSLNLIVPPTKRTFHVKVDNNVMALSRSLSIFLYFLLFVACLGFPLVYLAFT